MATLRHDDAFRQAGFTLVEVVVVIVLFALLATSVVSRFDVLSGWKDKESFRSFLNTWEFLFRESAAKGDAFRLVIDLDRNSYSAYREIPNPDDNVQQVDRLKNLRLKSEQKRRAEQEQNAILSGEEEFQLEDRRQSESLEKLFFETAYPDPHGNVRLARPLDFPQLAESQLLPEGMRFRSVKVAGEFRQDGQAVIRFSPRGGTEFAIVYLQLRDQLFSVYMNPTTGDVISRPGEVDVEWSVGRPSQN